MSIQSFHFQLLTLIFLINTFSIYGQEFVEEEIVIKIKDEVSGNTFGLLNQRQVDARLLALGVKKVRKITPKQADFSIQNANRRSSINSKKSVDLIYKIGVNQNEKEKLLKLLATQSWVEYAEPIHQYELLFTPNDTYQGAHWGHTNTQTYEAWDISQGDTSIVIGIVDSGVKASHPSLASQLYYNAAERYGIPGVDDDLNGFIDDSLGYNFAEQNNDINDIFSHGTEVAGMAVAKVNDAFGTFGTGYQTRFMPIKITNNAGQILNVFEAMLYAAEMGCKIINVSLGRQGGGVSQYEQDIINYITEEYDVLIIAAAGNSNGQFDFYPSSYENVLSVAHSIESDERYYEGTYSYFVDIMAPGAVVPTTYIGNDFEGHRFVTGSSYAAPFAAGVASLLWAAYPDLNAKQIAQILRNSADDVYELAGNQNFTERLGKGRLNALNALNLAGSLKAVRASDIAYTGSEGELKLRGDTATISADFTNILSQLSTNAKVTLSSQSPYIHIIDSIFDLGNMISLSKKDNVNTPFTIYLTDSLPENHQIVFKLQYEDEAYLDYQYFYLYSDSIYDIINNNWSFSLEGNGRLGFIGDTSPYQGIGLKWNAMQIINDAGLIFSIDSTIVADVITLNDSTKNADFIQASPIKTESNDSSLVITETFYDTLNFPDLLLKQQLTFLNKEKYLTLTYQVINNSSDTLNNLSLGLFTDFLLKDSTKNTSAWDSLYQMGYVYENDMYFGIKLFDTLANFTSLNTNSISGINIADGFSDLEKYHSLAGNERFSGEADIAHINGLSLPKIIAGDTAEISFILAAGSNLSAVQNQIKHAAEEINYLPYQSEKPQINDTTVCGGETVSILWENGENYKFYYPNAPETSFQEGSELTIPGTTDSLILLVSTHDNVLESEKDTFTVYFNPTPIEPTLSLPDTTVEGEQFSVSVSNIEGLTLEWNMGDGQQYVNQKQIHHTYTTKGAYTISLIVENEYGCTSVINQLIQVLKKSETPDIADTLTVCYGEDLRIAPQNGTTFLFYVNDSLQKEGSELMLENIEAQLKIGIINISDDLNSEKKDILVNTFPFPDLPSFIEMPDSVNIEMGTLEINALYGTSWQWETSSGIIGTDQKLELSLIEPGQEKIILTVTDTFNCVYEEENELIVWNKTITSLQPKFSLENIRVYPSPVQEYLMVELPENLIKKVSIDLITLGGKPLKTNIELQKDSYKLDVSALPKGLFLLRLKYGQKTFVRKLLKLE